MAIQGQLDEFDALDFHEIPGVKGLDQEIGKLRILLERRNEQIARLEDNNTVLIKENKRLIDRVLSEQKHTDIGMILSMQTKTIEILLQEKDYFRDQIKEMEIMMNQIVEKNRTAGNKLEIQLTPEIKLDGGYTQRATKTSAFQDLGTSTRDLPLHQFIGVKEPVDLHKAAKELTSFKYSSKPNELVKTGAKSKLDSASDNAQLLIRAGHRNNDSFDDDIDDLNKSYSADSIDAYNEDKEEIQVVQNNNDDADDNEDDVLIYEDFRSLEKPQQGLVNANSLRKELEQMKIDIPQKSMNYDVVKALKNFEQIKNGLHKQSIPGPDFNRDLVIQDDGNMYKKFLLQDNSNKKGKEDDAINYDGLMSRDFTDEEEFEDNQTLSGNIDLRYQDHGNSDYDNFLEIKSGQNKSRLTDNGQYYTQNKQRNRADTDISILSAKMQAVDLLANNKSMKIDKTKVIKKKGKKKKLVKKMSMGRKVPKVDSGLTAIKLSNKGSRKLLKKESTSTFNNDVYGDDWKNLFVNRDKDDSGQNGMRKDRSKLTLGASSNKGWSDKMDRPSLQAENKEYPKQMTFDLHQFAEHLNLKGSPAQLSSPKNTVSGDEYLSHNNIMGKITGDFGRRHDPKQFGKVAPACKHNIVKSKGLKNKTMQQLEKLMYDEYFDKSSPHHPEYYNNLAAGGIPKKF